MGVSGCPVCPVSPGWDHWTMSWVTPPCQGFLPGVSSAVLFLFLWACWLLLLKLSNGARFHKPALYIHWRKAQTGCEDGGNYAWHVVTLMPLARIARIGNPPPESFTTRSRTVCEYFTNWSRQSVVPQILHISKFAPRLGAQSRRL